MNTFFKKILVGLAVIIFFCGSDFTFAASLHIEAPGKTLSNGEPVTVIVTLDSEGDRLSGIAGDFSYPSNLFDLRSIGLDSSVVSLWAKQPSISEEKYLDSKTHITFEGIFPGGYDGVRSPYYQGVRPGVVFLVTLVPKSEGSGSFSIDDITFNAYDQNATKLPSHEVVKQVTVPMQTSAAVSGKISAQEDFKFVTRKNLVTEITRSELIQNNAWYIMVNELEQKNSIREIFIAETNDYSANDVSDLAWKQATNPYVLFYQDRSKYVHVKIVYSNNTYTTKTLAPVENLTSNSSYSRILISIGAVLCLVYLYGKFLFKYFKKKQ